MSGNLEAQQEVGLADERVPGQDPGPERGGHPDVLAREPAEQAEGGEEGARDPHHARFGAVVDDHGRRDEPREARRAGHVRACKGFVVVTIF